MLCSRTTLDFFLCPLCLFVFCPCCLPSLQSKVLVSVLVTSPDLFHVVLRYANWGGLDVRGRVSVVEDSWNYYYGNCKCSVKKCKLFSSSTFVFVLISMLQIDKLFQIHFCLNKKKQHVSDFTVRTWRVERFKAITSIIADKIQKFQCFVLIYCALNTISTSLNSFCGIKIIQTHQNIHKYCVRKQQIFLA